MSAKCQKSSQVFSERKALNREQNHKQNHEQNPEPLPINQGLTLSTIRSSKFLQSLAADRSRYKWSNIECVYQGLLPLIHFNLSSQSWQFIFCVRKDWIICCTELLQAAGHFLIMDFISRDWNMDNLFPRVEWTLGVGPGLADCWPLIGQQHIDLTSDWLLECMSV